VNSLDIYIWNVSHGLAVSLVTPNGRLVAYDAGRSDTFSPLAWLASRGHSRLDCFVLSHPHADHLRDIDWVMRLKPALLWRPRVPEPRVREAARPGLEESVVDRYERELDRAYNRAVTFGPKEREWSGGCDFRFFYPPLHDNLNNMSIVLFVGYGGGYVCLPGDLEKEGWLSLARNAAFRAYLAKTTVLLAPHHGRRAGVCREAFALMAPQMCVISDGPFTDTSSSVYSALATEANVRRRSTGLVMAAPRPLHAEGRPRRDQRQPRLLDGGDRLMAAPQRQAGSSGAVLRMPSEALLTISAPLEPEDEARARAQRPTKRGFS
jgi:beta-lactamase superfamily II metal-dependent hydrolase